MTTFNWKITQTDYQTLDGFIIAAHWTATAVDGEYMAPDYGSCSFDVGTPNIPYDQVTEQDVLNWCWANGVNKYAVESSLQDQLTLQKYPVQASGTPWSN
jgi:hypothetical protein